MIPYIKHEITDDDIRAVEQAMRSSHLTRGPRLEEFEEALKAYTGAPYLLACSNGTMALWLAYSIAQTGTQFFIPDITFIGTFNPTTHVVQGDGQLLDVAEDGRISVETILNADIDPPPTYPALVYVTLRGDPFPTSLPEPRNTEGVLALVIDAAHGPLKWIDRIAAMTFSFHACKHVSCGEGGAIALSTEWGYMLAKHYRDNGRLNGVTETIGLNCWMSEMQAALGLSQLKRVDQKVARFREIAARYDEAFRGSSVQPLSPPDSWYHLYQVKVPKRDFVKEMLRSEGIGTQIHYPCIHRAQSWAEGSWDDENFPNAVAFADSVLSLPMYPTLTAQDQDKVITETLKAVGV